MSVSRDTSKGTWTVYAKYTDWQGKVKVLHKRGFKTKREAVEYEREYLLKKSKDVTMGFAQFVECYLEDLKPRLKYNTYLSKEHIIRTKILPYFDDKALADICTSDIMQWQNEILQMRDDDGKGYSPTYLKTISSQMSAIFNHATRYYDLKDNPCQKVGNMGKKKAKEMLFWTRDEFFQFIETMKSKPMSYYAFELLFWTGIREGELLALTREDVDLEKKILIRGWRERMLLRSLRRRKAIVILICRISYVRSWRTISECCTSATVISGYLRFLNNICIMR